MQKNFRAPLDMAAFAPEPEPIALGRLSHAILGSIVATGLALSITVLCAVIFASGSAPQ